MSDEVKNLASKRMISLVWRSGQSNSSALVVLGSSVLGDSSYGVFWIRFRVYDYSECFKWILGSGFQRAGGIRAGRLVGGIRLRLRVWLQFEMEGLWKVVKFVEVWIISMIITECC